MAKSIQQMPKAPITLVQKQQRNWDHIGRLRANCRALAHDLKLILEDAPESINEVLARTARHDLHRANHILDHY